MTGIASVSSTQVSDKASDSGVASTARILLIEDNDISRQLMSDYLQYYGYKVLSLSHGTPVLPAIEQFQPHAVLLDLKLPDIDGFALLQQFQQQRDYANIPVIVVSAFAFQSDQQRALSLGARRYFVKPVNLAKLKRAICEELNAVVA